MKEYHYSVMFAGHTEKYHGIFSTAFMQQKDIITKAKQALALKLDRWKRDAKDVIMFEIYRFELDNEIQVFKWEKQ